MTTRRVQFSHCPVQDERNSQPQRHSAALGSDSGDNDDVDSPVLSSWYTQKELRDFRMEIKELIDAHNEANGPVAARLSKNTRGLEIFLSRTRRELQKHFVRTIVETQRRIKKRKQKQQQKTNGKSPPEGEDAVLLQTLAAKYSQYARDRASEVALRDEIESRLFHKEEPLPPKKPSAPKRRLSTSLPPSILPSMAVYNNVMARGGMPLPG